MHPLNSVGRVRWGRSLPLVVCYSIALAAYLACLRLESAWAFVAAAVGRVGFDKDVQTAQDLP